MMTSKLYAKFVGAFFPDGFYNYLLELLFIYLRIFDEDHKHHIVTASSSMIYCFLI